MWSLIAAFLFARKGMEEPTRMPEPTDPAASPTPGAADPNAQAAQPGAGTDPANPSQVPNNPAQPPAQPQVDPKIASALKTLEDAGVLGKEIFTKAQHDGHMGSARRQWQADAKTAAEQAAAEAQRQAQEEQGQFKPLYETAQKEIEGYKATAARIEPVLKEYLDTLTKEWPKSILDKCPADAGYEARLAWYEGNKDVAAEFLAMKGSGDGKKPPEKPNPYVNGNGATPPPSGSQANDKDAVASQAPLYRTL
jgi:hypothetical protein